MFWYFHHLFYTYTQFKAGVMLVNKHTQSYGQNGKNHLVLFTVYSRMFSFINNLETIFKPVYHKVKINMCMLWMANLGLKIPQILVYKYGYLLTILLMPTLKDQFTLNVQHVKIRRYSGIGVLKHQRIAPGGIFNICLWERTLQMKHYKYTGLVRWIIVFFLKTILSLQPMQSFKQFDFHFSYISPQWKLLYIVLK